jgi:hypothetical protein
MVSASDKLSTGVARPCTLKEQILQSSSFNERFKRRPRTLIPFPAIPRGVPLCELEVGEGRFRGVVSWVGPATVWDTKERQEPRLEIVRRYPTTVSGEGTSTGRPVFRTYRQSLKLDPQRLCNHSQMIPLALCSPASRHFSRNGSSIRSRTFNVHMTGGVQTRKRANTARSWPVWRTTTRDEGEKKTKALSATPAMLSPWRGAQIARDC